MNDFSITAFFLEGGPVMFLLVFVLALGGMMGVAGIVGRSRAVATLTVVAAMVALALGVGGMMYGRSMTDDAIASVMSMEDTKNDPTLAERLRAQGYAESMRPVQLGMPVALVLGALGAIALGRASNAPPRS